MTLAAAATHSTAPPGLFLLVWELHHEGIAGFGPGARLGGFGYLFIAFAVVIGGWHWRSPRGPFHSAGRRGPSDG